MRLSKILEILETNIPKLIFLTKEPLPQNNLKIEKVDQVLEAVQNISEISSLNSSASKLLGVIPRPEKSGILQLHNLRFTEIQNELMLFKTIATQLMQTLKNTVSSPTEETIYFKIPPKLDLSSVGKTIQNIDQIFNQIISVTTPSTSIKFNGFDTGSEWLILVLFGGGLEIIYRAIKHGMDLALKGLEIKKQYLEIQKLEIEINHLSEREKLDKAYLDGLTNKYAKDLLKKNNEEPQNEDILRLNKSLKDLQKIFEDGGRVEMPLLASKKHPDIAIEIKNIALQLEEKSPSLLESKDNKEK